MDIEDTARTFELGTVATEPLEREELGENEVAYRNMMIIQSGVWTDSGSRETVWYSPEGIRNLEVTEDNVVNIMHDAGNEVSSAGRIEAGSLREENGSLYADIIIDTSNAAGQYADENLKTTLETEGQKGFGGPSVEIEAEGQQIEFNEAKGLPELKAGLVSGLGLVKNPASRPVSFARQTAARGVALASGEDNKVVYHLEDNMDRELADMEQNVEEIADELGVSPEKVKEALAPVAEESDEDEPEPPEEDKENEEDEEPEEGDSEENDEGEESEEEGSELEGEELQVIQEQIDELWAAVEEMKEQAMSESEMSEELSSAKEELADAETVAELEEAKAELDKRLSDLESEPKNPRTMSDSDDDDVWYHADSAPAHDSARGSTSY